MNMENEDLKEEQKEDLTEAPVEAKTDKLDLEPDVDDDLDDEESARGSRDEKLDILESKKEQKYTPKLVPRRKEPFFQGIGLGRAPEESASRIRRGSREHKGCRKRSAS